MNALTGDAGQTARLTTLSEYEVDGAFADPALDRLVHLASCVFNVPAAVLSVMQEDRELLIARIGARLREVPLDHSFCGYVVGQGSLLVMLDMRQDSRTANNPLVTGLPDLKFLAGVPLVAPSGQSIGALTITDTKPHDGFSEDEGRNLKELAALALDKLEARRLELGRRAGQARFEQLAASSPDAAFCVNSLGEVCFWNAAAERVTGYSAQEISGSALARIAPRQVFDSLRALAAAGPDAPGGRVIEIDLTRKNGGDVPVELSHWVWREGGDFTFGGILRVVGERRANEERLCRLANLDPLTGLPNRILLRTRIEHAIKENFTAAVLRIDLSGLKDINDSFGHVFGDAVLEKAAERLTSLLQPGDVVGRLGGNEFAVVIPGIATPEDAARLADSLLEGIAALGVVEGQPVTLGASAGIALFPDHGSNAEVLLSGAELALFQAKSERRHGRRLFSPGLQLAAASKRVLQNELRRAYEQNEFELFYQPQIRLANDALAGAEALLRWRHPQKGLLTPNVFLPALEAGPLAALIGDWTLRTACARAAKWRAAGALDIIIAVNLFGAQFHAGDLAFQVHDALRHAGLPPRALELEITENIILSDDEHILDALRALRAEGVGITFDDYGTGYASFSMLKRFPVSRLKIDRSFVQGMCDTPTDSAIVRAILYLGRSFGLSVIAEGVETTEQSQLLRRKGCEQVQGFLNGRPMPAAEFERRYGLEVAPALMTCSSD